MNELSTPIPRPEIPAPFTFSQSSLQDYTDCARRFQLRYLEQLQWPAAESEPVVENERRQQEGQLFHRLVQQHLLGLPVEKLTRLAASPNLSRWWQNYLNHAPNLSGYTLHVETALYAPLPPHRVTAKYDLLAIKPGEQALIVDWKTYHKHPRDEWMAARWQTRIYRALLVQAGAHLNNGQSIRPEQIEMIYWYPDFPDEPAHFKYTSAQFQQDWQALGKIVAEIDAAPAFPLTDDSQKCTYCTYRSYCERGAQAGQAETTDVETELSNLDVNLEQVQEIEF